MENLIHVLGLHVLDSHQQRADDLVGLGHHATTDSGMNVVTCNFDRQIKIEAASKRRRDRQCISVITASIQAEDEVRVAQLIFIGSKVVLQIVSIES